MILSPLAGNTDSFVNNSEHIIKLIQMINIQNKDCLVSFDIVSLFTNIPVEEVLQIIIDSIRILLSQNAHFYKLKT
jgi:hypothetical protein